MRVKTLKRLVLYNYRYLFAYLIVGLFAVYFLAWRLGSLPNGVSMPELEAAAISGRFASLLDHPTYPLHSLLQWISLHLFGVSTISIRLPSIILAAATVVLLYNLLKKWFGKVTSLLAIAFLLSADWFLFIARSGTGAIEFSFWLTLLIFSMMKLIENKPRWLIGYGFSSALLLFSPFGIYAVITSTICLFTCAMFRKRANEASFASKLLFGLLPLISVLLISWLGFKDVNFLKALLGINALPTPIEFLKNMVLNASGAAIIWPDNNPLLGPSGIFLIRFVEIIFMLFGVIMLWQTRVNRLSIVVIANAIVLAIVSGLSSDTRGGSLLIIPAIIFFTCGLRHFIHRWQRTFPKNPYARVALYIPLSIMLFAATVLHFQSHFVLWPRQTNTSKVYLQDFSLLKHELTQPGVCAVYNVPKEYQVLLTIKPMSCAITFYSAKDAIVVSQAMRIISAKPLPDGTASTQQPKALTSGTQQNNVRWLVYQL